MGTQEWSNVQGTSHKKDRENVPPEISWQACLRDRHKVARLTFIDYDHDGDLDLYVTQPSMRQGPNQTMECAHCVVRYGRIRPDLVFQGMWRNNGDGTFTNVTETGFSDAFRNTVPSAQISTTTEPSISCPPVGLAKARRVQHSFR